MHAPSSSSTTRPRNPGDRQLLLPDGHDLKPAATRADLTVIRLREVIAYQQRHWRKGLIAAGAAALTAFVMLGCASKVFEGQSTLAILIQEASLTDLEHKGGGLTEQSAMQIVNNHRTTLETRRFMDFVFDHAPSGMMAAYLDGADRLSFSSRVMVALHLKNAPKKLTKKDLFAKKMGQLRRIEPVKDSHMISVTVKDGDPEVAARVANLYAQSYVQFLEEDRARVAATAQARLAEQTNDVRLRLDAKEAELAEFSRKSDLMKSGEAADMSVLMAQEVGKASAAADVELLRAQQRLQQLRAGLQPGVDVSGVRGLGDDMQLIEIEKMLITAKSRRDALLEYCGARHPKRVQCENEVKRLEADSRARIEAVIAAAESEEKRLVAEKADFALKLAEVRGRAFEQGGNRTLLKQLSDDVESLRSLQASLMKQQEIARMAYEVRGNANVEVIDNALPPEAPIWPSKTLALLASMLVFGGFMTCVPVGVGLSQDYLVPLLRPAMEKSRVPMLAAPSASAWTAPAPAPSYTPAPASTTLTMPRTFAAMPRLATREGPLQLNELLHRPADHGGNPLAPAVLHLERNRPAHGGTQVLLVTSAQSAEGKSLCAAGLAAALCQAGRSVLLMECNPSAPAVHQRYPGPGSHVSWIEHIESLRYGQSNLFLLSADQLPAEDVATLADGYRLWIDKACMSGVDWVILDAASLLHQCADVVPLVSLATDVVLVRDEARTDAQHVKAALVLLQRLASLDTLRGVIANQI